MVEHFIGNEEVSGSSPPNSLSRCGSVWLERCVRDAEAAGSNPVTSIIDNTIDKIIFFKFYQSCFFVHPALKAPGATPVNFLNWRQKCSILL